MAFGGKPELLLGAIVLLIGYLIVGLQHFRAVLPMLRRMRWLFLSIFIIYSWFTPGQPIFATWNTHGPTVEGVVMGLLRAVSLTAIVLAVGILIRTLPRDQLLSGILWMLRPLEHLGLPYERLSVRLALTLEYVHKVQGFYRGEFEKKSDLETTTLRERLSMITQRATMILENVLTQSQQIDDKAVFLVSEGRPPIWQWLYPLLIIGGFQLVKIGFKSNI